MEEEELRTHVPDFWNDQKAAEAQMRKVKTLRFWIEGYEEVAMQNMQKSHYAAKKISESGKFEPLFKGKFFNEFVVKSPVKVEDLNNELLKNKILGAYDLGKDYPELSGCTMICVTEKRTADEINKLIGIMEGM